MRAGLPQALLFWMAVLVILSGPVDADQEKACDVNRGPCSIRMGGVEVMLDIGPKPVKVMTPLYFAVSIKGMKPPDRLRIDLSMPGMYMGRNGVNAKKDASGRLTGGGIIPRCSSGRTLWQAKVPLGDRGDAVFQFHVVY